MAKEEDKAVAMSFWPFRNGHFWQFEEDITGTIDVFLFREKYNAAGFKEAHFCVFCVADREKWAVLEELYQLSGFPGSCDMLESF